MPDHWTDAPPAALIEGLCAAGLVGDTVEWTRLLGGRTNRLWRFAHGGQSFVCKLFRADAATPLFPNDAGAEAMALRALHGSGLAPVLCGQVSCPDGDAVVYEFVPAEARKTDPADIATALARLHRIPPPDGIRTLQLSPSYLLKQGDLMLNGLGDARARTLRIMRPMPISVPMVEPVFLHADVVPANVIATSTGPCLIDWQCPAIGDPTLDLAMFLSPAMQHLYGGAPLSDTQVSIVLVAYGDSDIADRYTELCPFYHWRMAAYCLWKVASGDPEYLAGFDLETAQLQKLG